MGHSMGGDVNRAYISLPLLLGSLRPLTNVVTAKHIEIPEERPLMHKQTDDTHRRQTGSRRESRSVGLGLSESYAQALGEEFEQEHVFVTMGGTCGCW